MCCFFRFSCGMISWKKKKLHICWDLWVGNAIQLTHIIRPHIYSRNLLLKVPYKYMLTSIVLLWFIRIHNITLVKYLPFIIVNCSDAFNNNLSDSDNSNKISLTFIHCICYFISFFCTLSLSQFVIFYIFYLFTSWNAFDV